MSKIALNLNDFKHLKSSKDSTTLQHKHGHVLNIAHRHLSKEAQEQLHALAQGGKVESNDHLASGDKKGISTQGEVVRSGDHKHAKVEASGRRDMEKHIKPKLAEGGDVTESEDQSKKSAPKVVQAQSGTGDGMSPPTPMAEGGPVQGPCKNPSCKSHGQAHPNCRCYGGMAKGGKVEHFCSKDNKHHESCKYYADGGDVPMGDDNSPAGMPDKIDDIASMKQAAKITPEEMETAQDMAAGTMGGVSDVAQGVEKGAATSLSKLPDLIEQQRAHINYLTDRMGLDSSHPLVKGANTMMNYLRDTGNKYKSSQKFADGGHVEPDDSSSDDQQDPAVNVNIQEPQQQSPGVNALGGQDMAKALGEGLAQGSQMPAQAAAPVEKMPVMQQQPPANAPIQQPPVQPETIAQAQESDDPMERFAASKLQAQDDLLKENQAFQQDLANGHIQPKTYADLFHDRSLLGKVGMIFGVMISGANAGLNGGPNAALENMNNSIKRDLEAQEQSKANAQNYLRLSQAHVMNSAQAGNLNVDTALKAKTLANMYMNQSVLHELQQQVGKLPPGSPQRAQAEQVLASVSQGVQNENYNLADRAAANQAYYKMMGFGGGSGGSGGGEGNFNAKQKAKIMVGGAQGKEMADFDIDRHIPGVAGQAERPIPEDIRNRVQAMSVLDNKGKDVLDFVQKHRGTWNPQTRAQATQKIEEMKNFYNDSIKGGALTSGRLGWYDEQFAKSPTDILSQMLGSTAKLKEMVNSNQNRRDLELKGLGFPVKSQKQSADSSSSQNQPVKGADGRMYIKSADGKFMVPVK